MFRRILIANRGEIALRVLRACRDLGIEAVVAHSQADAESLPVLLADDAVCVGPGPAGRSYLNIPNLITAALVKGCEAIHPGYGFLAEDRFFAEICERYGVTFIGPTPEVIARMPIRLPRGKPWPSAGFQFFREPRSRWERSKLNSRCRRYRLPNHDQGGWWRRRPGNAPHQRRDQPGAEFRQCAEGIASGVRERRAV